jgi:hypothetical protein
MGESQLRNNIKMMQHLQELNTGRRPQILEPEGQSKPGGQRTLEESRPDSGKAKTRFKNQTLEELDVTRTEEWQSGKRKHYGQPMRPFKGVEDWEVWLTQFKNRANLYNWCDEERALELQQALQGDACRILKETETEDGTFQEMCEAVGRRFNPPEKRSMCANELQDLKRAQGEDIDVYTSKWKDLYAKGNPKHPLEIGGEASGTTISQFIASLNDKQMETELLNLKLTNLEAIQGAARTRVSTATTIGKRYPGEPGGKRGTVKLSAVATGTSKGSSGRGPKSGEGVQPLEEGFEGKSAQERAETLDDLSEQLRRQLQSTQQRSVNEHSVAGTEPPAAVLAAVDIGPPPPRGGNGRGRGFSQSSGSQSRSRGPGGSRGTITDQKDWVCTRCGGTGHGSSKCFNAYHLVTGAALIWKDLMPTTGRPNSASGGNQETPPKTGEKPSQTPQSNE